MVKNKTQIWIIHGGMTFKNKKAYLHFLKTRRISIENRRRWTVEYLNQKLSKDFEIIKPRMPLQDNAKYNEWKIHFERHFSKLKNNSILIGCSLGGIFLAKYLSENRFPKKILSVYLVCPPFDNTLPNEDLVGGFKLKSNLYLIERNCKKVTLMFSKNDDVVPMQHAQKFRKKLKNATIKIYNGKNGHFNISKFPEIVKMIKEDINTQKKPANS
jgi:predicted alpha/beta hydrolase family esterase